MLRFSLGVSRMDRIRINYNRETAQVEQFGDKVRDSRLRWSGHAYRKDKGNIGQTWSCHAVGQEQDHRGGS